MRTVDEVLRSPSTASDLLLSRFAGGKVLSEICSEIVQQLAFEGQPQVDVNHPANERRITRTRVDYIDMRASRRILVGSKGLTTDTMRARLSANVPSLLLARKATAISLTKDLESASPVGFITLELDPHDASELLEERAEVWETLADIYDFPLRRLTWLDRLPGIRLAYIPSCPEGTNPYSIAGRIGEVVQPALPMPVQFAKVY